MRLQLPYPEVGVLLTKTSWTPPLHDRMHVDQDLVAAFRAKNEEKFNTICRTKYGDPGWFYLKNIELKYVLSGAKFIIQKSNLFEQIKYIDDLQILMV